MKRLINDAIRVFYVRRWAERIVQGLEDDLSRMQAIYDFILYHTHYNRDPYHLELLKTPQVSLQLIEVGEYPSLDCDDLTILSLSLLKSIGFKVALRATSYKPDHIFSHIYGLVHSKQYGWIPFDLVRGIGLDREHPGATKIMDVEV